LPTDFEIYPLQPGKASCADQADLARTAGAVVIAAIVGAVEAIEVVIGDFRLSVARAFSCLD